MNQEKKKRLETLESIASLGEEAWVFFRQETDEEGNLTSIVELATGQHFTPEEFWDLMKERSEAVFIPLQPESAMEAAEKQAYWDEIDACLPTPEDLLAENAAQDSSQPWTGPSIEERISRARETGCGADPTDPEYDTERARLARRYAKRLKSAEPFWEEMKARALRQSE